ncbi:MAG: lytic transglycosylase domain-containing protein [Xanthobacteraceae bacterium]
MRAILAFAVFVLGANSAAREPEYASFFADYFHMAAGASPPLIDIESATGRADRLTVAALQPHVLAIEIIKPGAAGATLTLASATADDAVGSLGASTGAGMDDDSTRVPEVSLDDLCNALYTSAQDNDLPIPFFANLLWQESRLKDDAVSKKGALGIAQFMPTTAAESGLDDPFNPLQAIPASARFLQKLRLQFGNLGFVAAAYNAGPRRVAEWLEHRRSLPRETRTYVVRVTGLSADEWRKIQVDDAALTFVSHLPCRSVPAFASLEQEQEEAAQLAQAKLAAAKAEAAATGRDAPASGGDHEDTRAHGRHDARRIIRARHTDKREAEHHPRAHDKGKNA